MNNIRENDLVEITAGMGTVCTARVRWVNEEGQAGITYFSPESHKGGASVVMVSELTLLQRGIGEQLKGVSDKALIAAITRLRGMRLPKKMSSTRRTLSTKEPRKTKLDTILSDGGSLLDDLLRKIKEEEGGDK